jgi:hypothetical protein
MRSLFGWILGLGLVIGVACAALADDLTVPTATGPLHGGHGAPAVVAPPSCPTPLPGDVAAPSSPGTPINPPGGGNAPNPFDTANMDSGRALAEAAGTSAPETATGTLLGDLAGGSYYTTVITVPVTTTAFPGATPSTHLATRLVRVPGIFRGSFKITEDESPRPMDRVFINYNYYNRLGTSGEGFTVRPDLNRETGGFEKTFLDGNASFGMRVPYIQATDSAGNVGGSDIGDITFIGKFAICNDRSTGNLLSAGLAVTAPTGPDEILADGSHLHSTLLQPYVGYIWNCGNLYVHGFSAVIVPTDSRDVTLLTNDVGVAYRAYCNLNSGGWLTEFTPTVEGHLTDPLNHRGLATLDEVAFPDIFVLTTGAHIGIGRNLIVTPGFAVPLTGPKPFDFEAIVQVNWRF